MDEYRDVITTGLDIVAVLLLAAGVAAWSYRWIGWLSLVAAAVILAGASAGAQYLAHRKGGR